MTQVEPSRTGDLGMPHGPGTLHGHIQIPDDSKTQL